MLIGSLKKPPNSTKRAYVPVSNTSKALARYSSSRQNRIKRLFEGVTDSRRSRNCGWGNDRLYRRSSMRGPGQNTWWGVAVFRHTDRQTHQQTEGQGRLHCLLHKSETRSSATAELARDADDVDFSVEDLYVKYLLVTCFLDIFHDYP